MTSVTGTTEFPAVPMPESFPKLAIAIIGKKGAEITVDVAPREPPAGAKDVKSFGSDTDVWSFGANTIAANLAALAQLSKYLQKESEHLGKPAWSASIVDLVKKLDEAVTSSNNLCDATNKTLSANKSS